MAATSKRTVRVVTAETKWSVSRRTGYNVCSLYVEGRLAARCNGGGYDMVGTVFGDWIAATFADRLRRRIKAAFYGLKFHDPDFDASKATVPGEEGTIGEREATGASLGLERYQAVYRASSDTPTRRHRVPSIDGACGEESVRRIFEAIGGKIEWVYGKTGDRGAVYRIKLPRGY